MARLVAGWDWSATPLGQLGDWPPSLRTVVRTLLASRFPMWMGTGPELTFIYNDAYRQATLGPKHPWALGRPAREVWAEIWDDIGPRIEAVLASGEATWDQALQLFLERFGFPEETYHTFSYSPLTDDGGAITGMLCVVSEETTRVIGERRLATLRDLAAALAVAQTEEDTLHAVQTSLAANPHDLPFTLTYLCEPSGEEATLAFSTGVPAGHPGAPASVTLGSPANLWPLSAALPSVKVDNLAGRLRAPMPAGAWQRAPDAAMIVPLRQPGQDHPAGFLVAGLNPHRPTSEEETLFVELIGSQMAAGIANARAYEAERRRAAALAELDRAKSEFFSNVSHEFRTPLTLILGPVEEALASPPSDDAAAMLATVRRNALRLGHLVDRMLDFSRLEAGRMRVEPRPVDLSSFTADLAAQFRSAIERAGVSLAVELHYQAVVASIDPDMWERIVLNLISNAFKFTFEGMITVRLAMQDATAVLTVSDTGIGIPPEELPQVFDRFHRIRGARSRTPEGTGIGLALVQELVHVQGGDIDVESVPGVGTAFQVRVPAGVVPLPTGEGPPPKVAPRLAVPFVEEALRWLPEPPGARPASPGGGSRSRVVVVDDNADLRDYLCRILGTHWSVEAYRDGAAAAEAIGAAPPDLVVTDVMMPGLDGFALLKRMRENPATRQVPVILLSARSGEQAAVEGLAEGADDYLAKPFSSRELVARVKAHLDLARLRESAARSAKTQARRLARLAEAAVRMSRCPTIDDCLRRTTDTARELLEANHAVATLTVAEDPAHQAVCVVSQPNGHAPWTSRHGEPPAGTARWRRPLAEPRPYRLTQAELEAHPEWRPPWESARAGTRVRGLLSVPMLGSNGQVLGLVQLSDKAPDTARAEFDDDDQAILVQLAQLAASRIESLSTLQREQQVAATLQNSLLPDRLPSVRGGLLAARYIAASHEAVIGGDWYDAFLLPDETLAFVVGDVVGHGVRAAATMGQLRNALRAFLFQGFGPGHSLELLNRLVTTLSDEPFATAVCAVFDPATGVVRHASAGHPPVVIVSASGEVAWPEEERSLPLGTLPDTGYPEAATTLRGGSTFLAYTDGLIERRKQGLDAGMARLARHAASAAGDPEILIDAVVGALDDGIRNDDTALLALTRDPAAGDGLHLAFPATAASVARARGRLRAWLRSFGLVSDQLYDLVLAAGELMANAVEHPQAASGPDAAIRLAAWMEDPETDPTVIISVSDRGAWREGAPGAHRGRGLGIVDAIADARLVNRSQEGTTVTIHKRLTLPSGSDSP